VSATKLAAALLAITPGRHILAWSFDPSIEATWNRLNIAGAMQPDAMLVSLENISANKLDYYLRPYIGLHVEPDAEGNWLVTVAVALDNAPRTDTSKAIDGGTFYVKPKDHRVYLDLHLPGDAYGAVNLPVDQAEDVYLHKVLPKPKDPFPHDGMLQPGFTLSGLDPPNNVVGTRYTIPYGTTRTIVVQFHLPGTDNHITVLPSGRIAPQLWTLGKQAWGDDHKFVVRWPQNQQ
jgi:hypothetical protein